MSERIRIGISACLLGEPVRFDGGHKRDPFLTNTLGRFVEWVQVCPEVEVGMGTPRATIRLEKDARGIRLVAPSTRADHTAAMTEFAERRVRELAREDLDGYVLKKDSPSCGMERVKVYDQDGVPEDSGRGLFAAALLARYPDLPVEEEGRLSDPRLRENFIERVFAYSRLKKLFAKRWTPRDLLEFHSAHELVLRAHSSAAYRSLGQLIVAAIDRRRAAQGAGIARPPSLSGARRPMRAAVQPASSRETAVWLAAEYQAGFMRALKTIAKSRRTSTHRSRFQDKPSVAAAPLDAGTGRAAETGMRPTVPLPPRRMPTVTRGEPRRRSSRR